MGFATIADKRSRFATALEHCDLVSTLCGVTDPLQVKRSICAMGHKWLWNADLGGLPTERFLVKVDPLFAGVREKLNSRRTASSLGEVLTRNFGSHHTPGLPLPLTSAGMISRTVPLNLLFDLTSHLFSLSLMANARPDFLP